MKVEIQGSTVFVINPVYFVNQLKLPNCTTISFFSIEDSFFLFKKRSAATGAGTSNAITRASFIMMFVGISYTFQNQS